MNAGKEGPRRVLTMLSQCSVSNLARSKILTLFPILRSSFVARIVLYGPTLYGITQIPGGAFLTKALLG